MAANNDTKALITCQLCTSKFESPVILPCGETLCKKHVHDRSSVLHSDDTLFSQGKFICMFCNEEHKIPTKSFPVNKAIEKLLEMNLDKLDLGKSHRNAKISYTNLSAKLDVFVHLQNDPVYFIADYFSDLTNKVDLSREQVILKINDFYDKMITDIKYHQSACEQTVTQHANEAKMGKRTQDYLNQMKKILQKWDIELNTIDFAGDKKWKNIDIEAKKLIDNIQFKIDSLKRALLLNTTYEYKANEIYIDPEWFGQLSIVTNEKTSGKEIANFNRHLIEKDNYSYYRLVDYQELIGTWDDLSEFKQDEWNTRLRQFNEANLKLDQTNFENLLHDEEQNEHLKSIIETDQKYASSVKKSYNVVIWDNMWDFSTNDSFVFDYFVPVFKILNPEYEDEFKNELGFVIADIDKKKEADKNLNCNLCRKKYNLTNKKPKCLIPCGHTYCDACIINLFDRRCPSCHLCFNQSIPDYQIIDAIKHTTLEVEIKQNTTEIKLRPEIIHLINEGTKEQQLLGITRLRKLLSIENNPPIQEVIDSGLVPKLVEYLDADNKNQSIQFEATWALTNIVSGNSEQTKAVVKAGAVKNLIRLISSSNDDISEQAIWALGNIAGDCGELRDMVIDNGIVEPMINVLSKENCKESLRKNGIWTLSNLCRNKNPLVDLAKIKPLLPIFRKEIEQNKRNENETLIDACWAISYLTDGPNERIAEMIKSLNLNDIVELLKHPSSKVVVPCLRTVANIVSGDDVQTQAILDCGLLPTLSDLIKSPKDTIRKEVCWSLSNITAGTVSQIQDIKEAGFFPKLVQILKKDSFNVRKEAAWAIANAISGGSKEHLKYLVDLDIISILCDLLKSNDEKIVTISIESLWNLILNCDDQASAQQYAETISEYKGFEIIEILSQTSRNNTIIDTAFKLLDYNKNNEE